MRRDVFCSVTLRGFVIILKFRGRGGTGRAVCAVRGAPAHQAGDAAPARARGVRREGESLIGPQLARAASRTELRRTPAPVPARARGCGRSAEAGAFGRGGRAHARSRRLLHALPACVGNHGLCASTHV